MSPGPHLELLMPGTLSPRMLIVLLGALVAIGPLSIDMYLSSLPAISVDLATTPDAAHLTVSAFLLGFCIGMLVYGPLSDQVGRRVLILLGLGLYTVASIGCLAAEDIHALVALRFLQALGGGAAAVLGRTIVRDVFAAEDAARVLSLMQAVTMLAPLFAPVLGGHVAAWLGWRPLFGVLALFGIGCLAIVAAKLPETLPRAERSQGGIARAVGSYAAVLSHRRSLALIIGGGSAFAGMFVYITASPFVYVEHFGVRPEHYGYLFGLNILGILAMTLLNARLVRRYRVETVLALEALAAALAGAALACVTVAGVGGLGAIVALLLVYVGVTGPIGANCIGLLLGLHRADAGTASAAFGTTQFGLGAIASACVGFIDGPQSLGLLVGACGGACLMGIALACVHWRRRDAGCCGGIRAPL